MNTRYKKLFSIPIAPILVFYFAFAPIFVFPAHAQIQPPPGPGGGIEPGFTTPEENAERQRLADELNAAKPNETVTQSIVNPANLDKLCGTFDIRCAIYKILYGIGWAIVVVPLTLSGRFLDWMTDVNLSGAPYQSGFVVNGWGISRDIANMFFVFIVLWMALATIFQFETYSAKRLLPKLIIVALLVNFSLPIGTFFIQTTNAIGKVFYDVARDNATLSDKILEIARIPSTIKAGDISKADADAAQQDLAQAQGAAEAKCNGLWEKSKDTVKGAINWVTGTDLVSSCVKQETISGMKNIDGVFTNAYTAVFWMIAIGLVSSFVFFAGGVFLLVRYLSLTILLIFGPLAFLFMILPATQEHWNKWWNKLIQWSFFMPVFMFMIMLSTRLGASLLTFQIASEQNASGANDSIASLSFQYILIIGLFIESLLVANSMGIAMSGTVVGWGRKMAYGAGKYAKGKGIQYAKIGAGGIAGGIQSNALLQKTLSSIPLLGGQIARGLGKTRAVGEAAEKQRQKGKFGFAERLSDEARGNYIASERAGTARDLLAKMDEGDRRRTVNALSTQGQIELAGKLRSVQSEALVGNATNNPEVYARLSGEAGSLSGRDYLARVAEIAHTRFQAGNIAPDFLRGAAGREYLRTATEDELRAIAGTRRGAEALGNTLTEVARTIHGEVETERQQAGAAGRMGIPTPPPQDFEPRIRDRYLSPQTQQYLNTAPGMYEGRMAMRIRRGGENNQENEDEQFFRRIRGAAQRGLFQQPEN